MIGKRILVLCFLFWAVTLTAQKRVSVAHNNTADFTTIQAAINSIPANNRELIIIDIAAGIYSEKIFIKNSNIQLNGKGREETIITQSIARDEWRCEHKDDWGVATINIDSSADVIFSNLTIRNNYGFENTGTSTIACASDSTGKKTVRRDSHQMAFRSFKANKLSFINCRFLSYGGDTMSPWDTESGMFYYKNCIMEGGVDFYCPRGWAYAENCTFISHSGPAAIWHDGSQHKDSKTVLVNCAFKGFDGFMLGRYHRDAQFYLINCLFAENMADKDIYLVPTANILKWDRRVYYYNCTKVNSTGNWFKNNLEQAEGNPDPLKINAEWVFNKKWNPAEIKK
jgi:pectinesterase